MHGELTSDGLSAGIWLAAFAASLLCAVYCLWCLAFAKGRTIGWAFVRFALIGVVVLFVADACGPVASPESAPRDPWIRVLIVAAGTASILLLLGLETRLSASVRWERWGRSTAYMAVSVAALSCVSAPFSRATAPPDDVGLPNVFASQAANVLDAFALTDRGQRIALERYLDEEDPAKIPRLPETYYQQVIARDQSERLANCHGWVFTGGRFSVRGAHIDAILEDNGYEVVADPQPGDVIVYRGADDHPVHTGLVKAVGAEGFVLIESKWGSLDVYLHEPLGQPYATDYAYHRSPREGHHLLVLETEPAALAVVGETQDDSSL